MSDLSIGDLPLIETGRGDFPPYLRAMMTEALKEAKRRMKYQSNAQRYAIYRDDPVGFIEEVLGATNLSNDIKRMCEAIVDNRVVVAQSSNSVGKTFAAAHIALWFYKCFAEEGQDTQVYTTAAPPFENLKRLLWGEIYKAVRKNRHLFQDDIIHTMYISRGDRSFITGVAVPTSGTREERVAKFSGKHADHLLFIVDEGDAVPDEVYEGIEACMSSHHVRLLVLFNPKAKIGPVYRMQAQGVARTVRLSAFRHPNVVEGRLIIPAAIDRGTVVRRINEWSRPLYEGESPDDGCFQIPDFLVGATAVSSSGAEYLPLEPSWRRITDPALSYTVLGEYPPQGENQLFDDAWITAAVERWKKYQDQNNGKPPPGERPIIGIDVAEMGNDANVICYRYGSYVANFQTWNGIDPDTTALRAVKLYRNSNAKIAFVDATGPGAGVASAMVRYGRMEDEELDRLDKPNVPKAYRLEAALNARQMRGKRKDEEKLRAIGLKVNEAPSSTFRIEQGEFYQLRDQLWWALREWLRNDPNAMIPPHPMLEEDLRMMSYTVKNGKIRVTDKLTARQLIRRSPDFGDALCLTFAPVAKPKIMRLET